MKNEYIFKYHDNLSCISDLSEDKEMYLSCLIGHTLSSFMRDLENPLELVRVRRGEGNTIIARRRLDNTIKCEIYEKQ